VSPRPRLGSCGDTSEVTASRIHAWAGIVMAIAATLELAALVLHGIMAAWHWASTRTHLERARERGEL